jgi:opacity protein-like surface antigen
LKSAHKAIILVILLALPCWQLAAHAADKPDFQVIVEGGLTIPQGDLSDDFNSTTLGFGAANGFEAGFRVRYYFTPSLSLSPAFHFLNPGDFSSEDEVIGEYSLQANSYRYTVELMLSLPEPKMGVQPFVAGGLGLFRNRYQGFTKPFVQEFDRSVNTLGFTMRAGLRIKEFELSCVYDLNHFSSYQFFAADEAYDYNWDTVTVRLGWIIPFAKETP